MSSRVSFTQHGGGSFSLTIDFGEVIKLIDALPDTIRGRLVRGVFKEAMTPMLTLARANAPVGETGRLFSNIKIRTGKRSGSRLSCIISSSAGAVAGKAANTGDTYYGYFQERGFKHHFSKKQVPGKHYMAAAFDATQEQTVQRIEQWLTEGVQSYFRK